MTDITRIYFGARKTILESLKDRGYKVPENLFSLTEKEFEVMYDKKEMNIGNITDTQGRPVFIRIIEHSRQFNKAPEKQSIFKDAINYFSSIGVDEKNDEDLFDSGRVRLIVIYNSRHAGQTQNKYEEEYIAHPFMEVYQVHLLYINPKHGKFQKKFKLISDQDECTSIYRRYNSKPLMLASICIDDPMNRYYKGRPAEDGKLANIYEITDGTRVFYRKVISKRMNLK